MPEHEQVIGQFYRRLASVFALRQAVAAITIWAFLWGTAVLVLRATQGTPAAPLLWAALTLPVVAAVAAWFALRRLPDRTAVRALLDRTGECGGLLMAGAERDLGPWAAGVAATRLPQLRWNYRRPLALLSVACGYVLLGFLVPAGRAAHGADSPLDVDRAADRLAEQVRVLKEEKIIDQDRAETLRQKLDEVRAKAGGRDPAKTLEALDHLDEVVKQEARKAAESAARKSDRLGQLGAGAEAIQAAAPSLDPKETAALMAELAAMTNAAAGAGDFDADLDGDLAQALKGGKLSPELLAQLAAAAKAGKTGAKKTAKSLYDARLIDGDQLKACEGECDGKWLAEFLKKNGGKSGLAGALAKCAGRGGVDEGGGPTELTFGDPSSEAGVKFREEALPPADLAALKASSVAGVSKATPQRDPKAGSPTAGSLRGATAGGGSATATEVLPQHKAAVGRYFDRPAK